MCKRETRAYLLLLFEKKKRWLRALYFQGVARAAQLCARAFAHTHKIARVQMDAAETSETQAAAAAAAGAEPSSPLGASCYTTTATSAVADAADNEGGELVRIADTRSTPATTTPTTTTTPPPTLVNEATAAATAERPSRSYKDLIIEAIESSPERRLKLSEIYHVIRLLHPYYRQRTFKQKASKRNFKCFE